MVLFRRPITTLRIWEQSTFFEITAQIGNCGHSDNTFPGNINLRYRNKKFYTHFFELGLPVAAGVERCGPPCQAQLRQLRSLLSE